jgi:hypothetical protein
MGGPHKIDCPSGGTGKIAKPKEMTRGEMWKIFEKHMMQHFAEMDRIRTGLAAISKSK